MAITPAGVEDEIASSLYNEIVSFINGTTPESGSANPGNFVRFNSAAAYGVTAGNADTTNGLAFKAQYGDPSGTPTTLLTVAKAGIDHQVLSTFLSTGKAIASLGDTPKVAGGTYTARDYDRLAIIQGSQSAPVNTGNEMLHFMRHWTPTGAALGGAFGNELHNAIVMFEASGVVGAAYNMNALTVIAHSVATGAHAVIGIRSDGYGNAGADGWGGIVYGHAQSATKGATGLESGVSNDSGTNRGALLPTLLPSTILGLAGNATEAARFTCGINILSTGGKTQNVGLFIQGAGTTTASGFQHGVLFDTNSIATSGYGIDMRSIQSITGLAMGALTSVAWNNNAGSALAGSLVLNASDQLEIRNTSAVRIRDIGATLDYVTIASTGMTIGGQANGQSLGLSTLTEAKSLGSGTSTFTTAIQIPAGAVVMAVSTRVTGVPGTSATYDVGVAGATTRYSTGISTALGTTSVGTGAAGTMPLVTYTAATSITLTTNVNTTNANGVIRVTIHYWLPVVATS